MKVIPKFQRGGGFESFFTTYVPAQIQSSNQTSRGGGSSGETKTKKEKGELTEKDFFDMLKDIDGLPNEMSSIVGSLINLFRFNSLTGVDPGDLTTLYLSNLYEVKVASDNKKTYDKAIEQASKNGAMTEPAISIDGKLVVQDNGNGKITTVSLSNYFENKDQYAPLTVSNLANLRAYSPELAYNTEVFNIINNSVGFESFQALMKQAAQTLGSTEYTRNGMFSAEGSASKGLALLYTLREDDRVQAMGSVTAEGLYKYKIIDKNQLGQINALTDYMLATLPDNAKTWAAFKLKTPNKDEAAKELIVSYLTAGVSSSHTFDIDYQGSMDKITGTKTDSSETNPKEGFWVQVQTGKGGDDTIYSLLNNTSLMQVSGKYYGTTPGLEVSKSFNAYLADSGVRNVIKNMNNITFGNIQLSSNSYNDVIIDANGGAMTATLPITPEGKVDFSVLDTYTEIQNKLKEQGLTPNTREYTEQLVKELTDNGLNYLVDAQRGIIDINKFGHFLILKGVTSSKAVAVQNNKKVNLDDVTSDYIVDASDDDQLYNVIRQTLSTKDSEYKLDENNWYDWNGWDKLYSGNIFIPLNMNTINGMNADDNDIKSSTALEYEQNMQRIQKLNNQKSTGSNLL